jgi:succinate-semialdehyde dehydrogenase/glutarate-semialdehyde dehydrogenase
MPSAELDRAADVAVVARCQNNGQSCIAAKRFIVHEAVADRFEGLFAQKLAALKVGDPMADDSQVGPLATESGLADLEKLVDDAVANGARVVVGGQRPDRPGWYYLPTLLADVTANMRIHRDEAFGPVATLYRVPDLESAIALANDSDFGLGSNIWTEDAAEQAKFVRDVEAGMVFVNGMTTSYAQLPFGGVKASGYGRELTELGMREFLNIKSVWVGAQGQPASAVHAGNASE